MASFEYNGGDFAFVKCPYDDKDILKNACPGYRWMRETKRWRIPAQHLQSAKAALGGGGEHCRGIAPGPGPGRDWLALSGVLSTLQMGNITVPIPTHMGGGNTSLETAYCAARTDDPAAQRRILQTANTRAAHGAAGRASGTPLSVGWDDRRDDVLVGLTRAAFRLDSSALSLLLQTGDQEIRDMREGGEWTDQHLGYKGPGRDPCGRALTLTRAEARQHGNVIPEGRRREHPHLAPPAAPDIFSEANSHVSYGGGRIGDDGGGINSGGGGSSSCGINVW